MSRSIFSAALSAAALTAALPGTGLGLPGTGTTSPAPAVSASVEECVTAAVQAGRSVTFAGQMETVAGAHRMAMRIVVQERAPGEAGFHALAAVDSGTWQRSEGGLKIFKYVRQVTDLPAPADFRAIVAYRWLGERGRVVRTTLRHTPVCREPGGRLQPETAPAATIRGA